MWTLLLSGLMQLQSQPPTFTTGPTQHTTQPPAPATQFTTGPAPASPSTTPGFTTGSTSLPTGTPSYTSGPSGSFTTGNNPSNTAAPSFTSGPVPLTTGAFAQPVTSRWVYARDGVIVGNTFIPVKRKVDRGPRRDVYLPALEKRLEILDERTQLLRTRAFEYSGDDRDELQRLTTEAAALLQQAHDGTGSLRNVVDENFGDARDLMDALLLDVTQRLDAVEARLAR